MHYLVFEVFKESDFFSHSLLHLSFWWASPSPRLVWTAARVGWGSPPAYRHSSYCKMRDKHEGWQQEARGFLFVSLQVGNLLAQTWILQLRKSSCSWAVLQSENWTENSFEAFVCRIMSLYTHLNWLKTGCSCVEYRPFISPSPVSFRIRPLGGAQITDGQIPTPLSTWWMLSPTFSLSFSLNPTGPGRWPPTQNLVLLQVSAC